MRSSISLFRVCSRATPPRTPHIPAFPSRWLHSPRTLPTLRTSPVLSRVRTVTFARFESSAAPPTSTTAPNSRLERDQVPSYELTFTCNVCKTRSSHRLSKQGYHHGTVLISCPDCKNRHLISDHLKVSTVKMTPFASSNPTDLFGQISYNRRLNAGEGQSCEEGFTECRRRCRILG